MFVRLGQLTDSAEDQKERREIKKASEDLLSIQIRDLGWPASVL